MNQSEIFIKDREFGTDEWAKFDEKNRKKSKEKRLNM
jgi:hypothetical protein